MAQLRQTTPLLGQPTSQVVGGGPRALKRLFPARHHGGDLLFGQVEQTPQQGGHALALRELLYDRPNLTINFFSYVSGGLNLVPLQRSAAHPPPHTLNATRYTHPPTGLL